jgi:putrescine aminotransferase
MTVAANTNQTRAWQHADSKHHLHPFTKHPELREAGPRVITRGEGVYVYDSEGHRMLDGMAGLWCVQLGYSNDALVQAGTEALRTLPYYNAFFQTTNPYVAELSELISTLTPEGLDQILFANSGSEANDTAIKMIRYYWNLRGKPDKKSIITREDAYHGVTLGAASMAGLKPMHPQFDLPLPGFHHISPAPYKFGNGADLSEEAFADVCVNAVEDKILELGPEKVAAFCGEPVMGAGGMRTPPAGYWAKIAAVCKKYDVLLWSDEVICGFGRTGSWFGCQTYGFQPDIMTVAKGLSSGYQPISATILGGDIGPVIAQADQEMAHGYTYSGHPVAAAVALANIREMLRLDLVGEDGHRRAVHFQEAIATLRDHPLVGEVRAVGYLGAVEIVSDKQTNTRFPKDDEAGTTCRNFCMAHGLIVRAVGDTMVMSPPLIISEGEIDELVAILRRCLDLSAGVLNPDSRA